jgi:hypothetical protein
VFGAAETDAFGAELTGDRSAAGFPAIPGAGDGYRVQLEVEENSEAAAAQTIVSARRHQFLHIATLRVM